MESKNIVYGEPLQMEKGKEKMSYFLDVPNYK